MANGFSLATTAEPAVAKPGINRLAALFGLLLIVGLAVGLYGFVVGHEHVYNVSREVPWGLMIAAYAFFAITSTGLCLLAAISHVYGGNSLAPLANRMVWVSLITIISGFMVIGMELESPWRMLLYNVISPNITSNIWWMGTLYGLAVGLILLEFWFILTQRWTLAIILGVMGALAEVAANTCLGGVFATLPARPFWYGGQLPVYFLACAFLSGSAAAVLSTHYAYAIRGHAMDSNTRAGIQAAGKILLLMLILVSVSTFWKMASFLVGGPSAGRSAVEVLFHGSLAINFWLFEIAIGLAGPIVLLALSRMQSIPAMSTAALMALVGMFFGRLDMVVAGQVVPHYSDLVSQPAFFVYTPSGPEWLVVLAGIGLTGLAFLQGERFFGRIFALGENH